MNFANEPLDGKVLIGSDRNCETESEDMSEDGDDEEIDLSAKPTTSKPTRKQMRKSYQN